MFLYKVTLVFENCGTLDVDGRHAFGFHMSGVHEECTMRGFPYEESIVFHNQHLTDFSIGMLKELEGLENQDFRSLCAVEVVLWDGFDTSSIKHNYYYLPWDGTEHVNSLIHVSRNIRGDVWITVGDRIPDISKWFYDTEDTANLAERRGLLDMAQIKEDRENVKRQIFGV